MLAPSRLPGSTEPAPLLLLIALLGGILPAVTALASQEARQEPAKATLLVLDNRDGDDDLRTPPFGDTVLLLNSSGELVRQIPSLRVGGSFSGCRAISASGDGRSFSVLEDALSRMSVYEISTGTRLWSLSGMFRSAVFADELLYAVTHDSIYAIDRVGTIVKHSRIDGGIDIAFDPLGKCLWIAGIGVKKCNLDLKLQFEVKLPFNAMSSPAFSVDVYSDGSAWIATRDADEQEAEGSKLLKISPEGRILRVIYLDFFPQYVRIDRSDGSVWTTGRIRRKDYSRIGNRWPETAVEPDKLIDVGVQTYTRKYDPEGRLLVASSQGGTSIEVDPSDGSVWIAGDRNIWYYSGKGTNLATYTGVSANRKWLALVPSEAGRQSQPGQIDRTKSAPSPRESRSAQSNPILSRTAGISQK